MQLKADERGFTLIEVLVVVVIIAVLAALVGPRLFAKVGMAKQKAAAAQIELFRTALDSFRLDTGRYPSSQEGLEALWTKPTGIDIWAGPYLNKPVPKDPWGHEYLYTSPGEHGEFDIICYGADGTAGGDKDDTDIVSWKNL